MTDRISPALTPEEWERYPDLDTQQAQERYAGSEYPLYHRSRHGIAAANLHGQPFGFTREDVEVLKDAVFVCRHKHIDDAADHLESLADRIAALLPPETPA